MDSGAASVAGASEIATTGSVVSAFDGIDEEPVDGFLTFAGAGGLAAGLIVESAAAVPGGLPPKIT
jgi:hypothetical protein